MILYFLPKKVLWIFVERLYETGPAQSNPSLDKSSQLPAMVGYRSLALQVALILRFQEHQAKFLLYYWKVRILTIRDVIIFFQGRNILQIMDNHRLKGSVLHRCLYLEILKRETAESEACTQAQKVCFQGFCPCLLTPCRRQILLHKPPCSLGVQRPWHRRTH